MHFILFELIPIVIFSHFALFFPGFCVLQRSKWPDLAKISLSITLSVIFISSLWFLRFVFLLSEQAALCVIIASIILSFFCSYKNFLNFTKNSQIRYVFASYVLVLLSVVTAVLSIRSVSGGWWYGDWYEHYERSLFFVTEPVNLKQEFLGMLLPSRPPLFNLLASFFLSIFGKQYYVYQLVACILNTLVFFPMVLFLGDKGKRTFFLALLLVCNPFFMQNATYTWTKLFAAFFVILSLWLFIEWLKNSDDKYFSNSVVCMALGILVHYSSAVYALVLFGYLIFASDIGIRKSSLIFKSLKISLLVLLPWFLWSIFVFDMQTTFFQNTVIADSASWSILGNIKKWCFNIFTTLVPLYFWGWLGEHHPEQTFVEYALVALRDYWFFYYQHNLLFAIGSVSWLVVLYFSILKISTESLRLEERFWCKIVPPAILLSILIVGSPGYFGHANICLAPIVLLGVLLLVNVNFTLTIFVRCVICFSFFVDFILGVVLNIYVQNKFVLPQINEEIKAKQNLVFLHQRLTSQTNE